MWILVRGLTAYKMEGAYALESKTLEKRSDGSLPLKLWDGPNIVINDHADVPKMKPKKSAQDLYVAELAKITGLTKPIRRPEEFGFKQGDTYVLVNAASNVAKAFDYFGNQVFALPCMATGQNPQWRNNSGDTPPGLYKIGEIYNDYARVGDNPDYDRTLMSYGWITFDLIDLEGNEDNSGRAGICAHGGSSALGWPGAWEPYQQLYPTLGCLRMHNKDLIAKVLPRVLMGTCYVAVYQDNN